MPLKYTKRAKKRVYRKRKAPRKRLFKVQKGLSLGVYPFKRQMPHQIVDLDQAPSPGFGWDTTYAAQGYIGKLFTFQLSEVAQHSDFVNLFKFYKINGANVRIYQATNALTDGPRNNSQCIITTLSQRDGDSAIIPPSNLECMPARRDKLLLNTMGKPHNIYMKLNQLSMVYASPHGVPPSQTNYGVVRPRWISTEEPNCEHYGLWVFIRSVNSSAFDNIQLRIEPTIYLQCKGCQ